MTELEDLDKELQEFEKSESEPEKTTKKTKSLTVTQTIEKFNELKEKGTIIDSEYPELVDPELAKSKKEKKEKLSKLITLKDIKKLDEEIKKLESGDDSENQPHLTPNEKVYVNFPVSLLEKFVEKEVFYELPSYVQEMIVNKIEKDKEDKRLKEEEKQRLIREQIEHQVQIAKDKQLAEEQERIAKEKYLKENFYQCPHCQQLTINKKIFNKDKEAICQNRDCRKKVEKEMTLDELEHMLDVQKIMVDKFEQFELERQQKQQEEMLKQQQEIAKQQMKEQLVKQPIQYVQPLPPTLLSTILDSGFIQEALSSGKLPETIEALRKAIGEQRTEQLADAIATRIK